MPRKNPARLAHLLPKSSGRWPKRQPTTPPLFEEIGPEVTTADIDLWMDAVVPRISAARRAAYVTQYAVAAKIMDAKRRGQWPPQNSGN